MESFVPDYYSKFRCTAERCEHNCCIGWEIDIDEDSLSGYRQVKGEMGERLRENIEEADGNAYFRLRDDERCPFLNSDNLCDIIISLGEGGLCNICTDHPRFRNYFSHRTETGLGLSCEEAARVILSHTGKFTLISDGISDEDVIIDIEQARLEEYVLGMRNDIFAVLTDREKSIDGRIEALLTKYSLSFPKKSVNEWADIFSSLEKLSDERDDVIENVRKTETAEAEIYPREELDLIYEQLICYFVFRHFSQSAFDGLITERILLSLLCFFAVRQMLKAQYLIRGGLSFEDICQQARLFSSEVEYSEENVQLLLDLL